MRDEVFQRAEGRREYCFIHQEDRPETHPIDHIVAIQHGGQTEIENLALSCLFCNCNKGPNLATIDPTTAEIVPLFNPRLQNWKDHFELVDGKILGLTAIGRATVKLLRLNDPEPVSYRQCLILAGRYSA
ncbi:MAG: HNH endonuclease signature motif containing protein [Acidobacteriota bacterium]|nr:HNH endonuclease signature motif containing protein [Acidobacteriota bacterium]